MNDKGQAVVRIVEKIPDNKRFQAGYLAMNKNGETGAFPLRKGFNYALYQDNENRQAY